LIQKDYDYVQGSTAKQLQYDVYEENTVLKAKKRYKNNRRIKFKLVLSTLAVLIAGLTVMYRFAAITQISYSINQRENLYNELRNENSLLKVEIETKTDLTAIKEFAVANGMQVPDKSQLVYIQVPRNDYTLVMNTQNDAVGDSDNAFVVFINKVAGLIRLFD